MAVHFKPTIKGEKYAQLVQQQARGAWTGRRRGTVQGNSHRQFTVAHRRRKEKRPQLPQPRARLAGGSVGRLWAVWLRMGAEELGLQMGRVPCRRSRGVGGTSHLFLRHRMVPPIPFLSKLAPLWPTLTFLLDYEEMGMGFKGITKVQGDAVEDHCLDL